MSTYGSGTYGLSGSESAGDALDLGTFIADYLEADETLMAMLNGGVNAEVRPTSTGASPFVRLDYLDGEDLMVIGLHRVWLDATYHIRGVLQWRGSDKPDREEINAIGARLDVLLHGQETTTGLVTVASWREEPSPTPATTEADGSLWLQSGGVYRFLAVAA